MSGERAWHPLSSDPGGPVRRARFVASERVDEAWRPFGTVVAEVAREGAAPGSDTLASTV